MYYKFQPIKSVYLKYSALGILCLPFIAYFVSALTFSLLKYYCSKKPNLEKCYLKPVFVIFNSLAFAIVAQFKILNSQNFLLNLIQEKQYFSKNTSIAYFISIHAILQSMPMLLLQGFNNYQLNNYFNYIQVFCMFINFVNIILGMANLKD
jgi:hypothetical protein